MRCPLGRTSRFGACLFLALAGVSSAFGDVWISAEPFDAWLRGVVFIGVGQVTRISVNVDQRSKCVSGTVVESWKGIPPDSVDVEWFPNSICFREADLECLTVGDRFVFLAFSRALTNLPTVVYVSPMRVFQRGDEERFELLYPVKLTPECISAESVRDLNHEEWSAQVVLLDEFRTAVRSQGRAE